jgi:hypothetical protein
MIFILGTYGGISVMFDAVKTGWPSAVVAGFIGALANVSWLYLEIRNRIVRDDRAYRFTRGLFSRSVQGFHLLPLLSFQWMTDDNPATPARALSITCSARWFVWGAWCTVLILTRRPWDQSAFWRGRQAELADAKAKLEAIEQAKVKNDEKRVRQLTARAMHRVNASMR